MIYMNKKMIENIPIYNVNIQHKYKKKKHS